MPCGPLLVDPSTDSDDGLMAQNSADLVANLDDNNVDLAGFMAQNSSDMVVDSEDNNADMTDVTQVLATNLAETLSEIKAKKCLSTLMDAAITSSQTNLPPRPLVLSLFLKLSLRLKVTNHSPLWVLGEVLDSVIKITITTSNLMILQEKGRDNKSAGQKKLLMQMLILLWMSFQIPQLEPLLLSP